MTEWGDSIETVLIETNYLLRMLNHNAWVGPAGANIFFGRGFDLENFLNLEIHL